MITRLLGIETPIIQAPMAGVQDAALTAAVCNAGGLGSLPCATLEHEALARELGRLTAMTDRPFNVNFFCHTPPVIDDKAKQDWLAVLEPYFEELGLDRPTELAGNARKPFNQQALEVIRPFEPAVVSFHFGLPDEAMLGQIKAWGARVISTATTVDEAVWLASHGADAVIAQGIQAGGHRGSFLTDDMDSQLGTWELVSTIRDAVELPIIAAGGIATAGEVDQALALGAAGVQVGTAFLLCPEAGTSKLHRTAIASNAARETAVTNVFTGRPARGIVNRLIREIGPMSVDAPPFPAAASALAGLRSAAEQAGRDDFTPMWCGENTAGCREIPAADLLRHLMPSGTHTT